MTETIKQIEVEYLLTPEVEQLEARYNSIIKGIYAEASEQMIGVSLRSQQHIHWHAIERARPFIEEIGRLRSRLLTRVTIPRDALFNEPERETDTQAYPSEVFAA